MAARTGIQLTKTFTKAILFAIRHHSGQYRKGNRAPYVSHPIAVSTLVLEMGGTEQEAVAAILHDVVEDCDVTLNDLESEFDSEVSVLVGAVTEQLDRDNHSWQERKIDYLEQLDRASDSAWLIAMCDKFHNLSSLVRDIRYRGDKAWIIFNADPKDICWYYQEFLTRLEKKFGKDQARRTALVDEFREMVETIKQAAS